MVVLGLLAVADRVPAGYALLSLAGLIALLNLVEYAVFRHRTQKPSTVEEPEISGAPASGRL